MIEVKFSSPALQPLFTLYYNRTAQLYREYLQQAGDNFLVFMNGANSLFSNLKRQLESSKSLEESARAHQSFKNDFLMLLNDRAMVNSSVPWNDFREQYLLHSNNIIEQLPESVTVESIIPHYPIIWRENPVKTFRKIASNTMRSGKIGLKRSANIFRSIVRANPLELTVSSHRQIPIKLMMSSFCYEIMPHHYRVANELMMQLMSRMMTTVWNSDERIDACFQTEIISEGNPNDTIGRVEDAIETVGRLIIEYGTQKEEILMDLSLREQQAFVQLDCQAGIVDTPELSATYLKPRRIRRTSAKTARKLESDWKGWKLTHTALMDDWSVDVEINLLYYSFCNLNTDLITQMQDFGKEIRNALFTQINKNIEAARKEINTKGRSKQELTKLIADQQQILRNSLTEVLLPESVKKLSGCFDEYFDNFDRNYISLTNNISTQRAFIQKKDYLHIAKTSEIKYISPQNLLEYSALPAFVNRIRKARMYSENVLEKLRATLVSLGNVCDFSLESALIKLEDQPKDIDTAIDVAVDGLERATAQLSKVTIAINDLPNHLGKDIRQSVIQFNQEIQKLKNNDNIFSLQIEIARIQTIKRTKDYGNQLILFIKTAYPLLRKHFENLIKVLKERIQSVKKRIGISIEKKKVSFELSEFIEFTHSSLERLPFVYQRLFRLEPTGEDRFFVGRQNEIQQLKSALNNWEKDRYITISLIGEKGNGTTSLVNYFLKHHASNWKVLRYTLHRKVYSRKDYFELMSEIFGIKGVKSNNEIIDEILKGKVNSIVVVENLQHMFLKQVNGFDVMQLFFEVMANTMKKVLWIGSFTLHSWSYLDKTIHVSNYFTNEINIQPMSRELLEELIYRRNNLSGYHIVYEHQKEDELNKKFNSADALTRQDILRKRFFMMLRQLSAGNVSLAQMYWLRSVRLLNDEEIIIKPVSEFDSAFLATLSNEELFALQALVIHDGLDLEDFALVMRKPVTATRNLLIPMYEKGFLIKPGVKYNINPIIFKSVCQLLTSRNFISSI